MGRSLYIGSFCPAITSLSRYLEGAAFNISISSSVFIFLYSLGKLRRHIGLKYSLSDSPFNFCIANLDTLTLITLTGNELVD